MTSDNAQTADRARASADALCSFVDASPSPFHVCATVVDRLESNGFSRLDEAEAWPVDPGRYFVLRDGSLVAWSTDPANGPADPYRIVGGHTDSPNLRLKQRPDQARAGWEMVGLEPYGGALLNSWLDRDLGVSGRVSVRTGQRLEERLVRVDRPVLRVPQLAIHLAEDRKGVELDPQRHVDAVWGIGDEPRSFLDFVAGEVEVKTEDVLGWELMVHDLVPSSVFGRNCDLVSAPRLDNQGTCFAATEALVRTVRDPSEGVVPVLALFDHEEVGSLSDRGAFSDLLGTVLERITLASGGTREDYYRALARSACASGDMAHATHPNYADRHEPRHQIAANGGPVLKVNTNLRYASDAASTGTFALACDQAGVPLQRYLHRADLPCGSTVGPIMASRTGIPVVDVGAPQLAMHSAREMMGAADPQMYVDALAAFLAPAA